MMKGDHGQTNHIALSIQLCTPINAMYVKYADVQEPLLCSL